MKETRRQFLQRAIKTPFALLLFKLPESRPKKIPGVFNPDRKGPGGYLVPPEYTEEIIAKFARKDLPSPSFGAATTMWLELQDE